MSICKGIAGKRGKNPVGIFIHNDAGSQNANAKYYENYLKHADLEYGFAHYYVCSDGTLQAEDDTNKAWHCGNTDGNANYLSIEVCQSMGSLETFLKNEEKALKLAADKCKQYGITPSSSTIRLHQEVFATACPHRSVEVHGGVADTKSYFVKRIKELMEEQIINATIQANTGSAFQRLIFESAGNGLYRIKDKQNKYYLTAENPVDGGNVDFRPESLKTNQKWKEIKKKKGHADYTLYSPAGNLKEFLSVENNGNGSSNLKLWTELNNTKQFFWPREEKDGTVLLIHTYTGKCVSAYNVK